MNWNIFDKIYCIHYLPYKERFEDIKKTLSGLNISQQSNFEWFFTTKNKIFNYLFDILRDKHILTCMTEQESNGFEGYIKNDKVFNLAINTYNLINMAYLLDYQRILIIEDDITPLKDKVLFNNIMENIPLDYNIISMEYWFRLKWNKDSCYKDDRKINDYFYHVINERLVNAGFVVYDRVGMKHFLDTMNQYFWNSDYCIPFQNLYDDWGIKRCVSKVPVVIQKQNYTMNHIQNMKWNYGQIGVDINNYDGYSSN